MATRQNAGSALYSAASLPIHGVTGVIGVNVPPATRCANVIFAFGSTAFASRSHEAAVASFFCPKLALDKNAVTTATTKIFFIDNSSLQILAMIFEFAWMTHYVVVACGFLVPRAHISGMPNAVQRIRARNRPEQPLRRPRNLSVNSNLFSECCSLVPSLSSALLASDAPRSDTPRVNAAFSLPPA